MRGLLGLIVAGLLAGSILPAQAEDWCGFHQKLHSQVRCGFTSLTKCKQAYGPKSKHLTCRLDSSFAQAGSGMARG